jgi:recombination protein RecA
VTSSARNLRSTTGPASTVLGSRSVPKDPPSWCLAELAGRLVELTGWRAGAVFSSALGLVVDAQRCGETVVWVGPRSRSFFPPDAESAGVDLAALPVVRLALPCGIAFAADVLARSGAFGLIVLDVGSSSVSLGVLSRLAGLARTHEAAIVLLTEKPPDRPSLGSVVSFRADTSFMRESDGSFAHQLAVTRDRVRAIGWRQVEKRRGPPGLS